MKYCTNCGTKLNDEDRFCTTCGNPMPVIESAAPSAPVVEPAPTPVIPAAPVVEPAPTPVIPAAPVVEPAASAPVNEIPAEDMNILNTALKMEQGEAPSYEKTPVYAAPAPETASANQQAFGAVDYGTKSAPQPEPQQYGYAPQQPQNYGYGAQQYGYTSPETQQYGSAPAEDANNKKPLISMILGIAGFACSASGILGVGLGIPAIMLSKSKTPVVGKNRTFSKLGKIFGIIGTILGAISLVAIIIIVSVYLYLQNVSKKTNNPDFGFSVSVQEYKSLDELYDQIYRTLDDSIEELDDAWEEIANMSDKELAKNQDKIQKFFDNTLLREYDYVTFIRNSQKDGFKLIAKEVKKNGDWEDSLDELYDVIGDAYFDYLDEIVDVMDAYFDRIDEAFDTIEFEDYEALYDIYDASWDEFYSIYETSYDEIYSDYSDVFDGFLDGETDVDKILNNASKGR